MTEPSAVGRGDHSDGGERLMLPPYVYDLIAAVQKYEDEHGNAADCFEAAMRGIPKRELDRAAAIAHYRRQAVHDAAEAPKRPGEPMCVGCGKLVARFDEEWHQASCGILCTTCCERWCALGESGKQIAAAIQRRKDRERAENEA